MKGKRKHEEKDNQCNFGILNAGKPDRNGICFGRRVYMRGFAWTSGYEGRQCRKLWIR